jgi:hypothetical protein
MVKSETTRAQCVVQKWESWYCGSSSRDFKHHANFVSRNTAVRLWQLPSGTISIQCVSSSNSSLRSNCYLRQQTSTAWVQATALYDLLSGTTRIRCLSSSNNSVRSKCCLGLQTSTASVQATVIYHHWLILCRHRDGLAWRHHTKPSRKTADKKCLKFTSSLTEWSPQMIEEVCALRWNVSVLKQKIRQPLRGWVNNKVAYSPRKSQPVKTKLNTHLPGCIILINISLCKEWRVFNYECYY